MSLDLYFKNRLILNCDCGKTHVVDLLDTRSYNITHNLGEMAEAAGIYKLLWRPEEIPVKEASEMIEPLKKAIEDMKQCSEYYTQFDPPNGWGTYKDFVPCLEEILETCYNWPNATVESSR